jgi:hypothetical protein
MGGRFLNNPIRMTSNTRNRDFFSFMAFYAKFHFSAVIIHFVPIMRNTVVTKRASDFRVFLMRERKQPESRTSWRVVAYRALFRFNIFADGTVSVYGFIEIS